MENEFFLNASFAPLLHMDPSIMPNWQQSPPPSTAELNSPLDCFYNNNHNWEKSTDQYSNTHFDSALSSMVSSPVASNSNLSTTDSFAIRELIGKLGSIGSAATATATPLNSPPKPPKAQLPLPDFAADPGFAERAARFSCFGSRSFNGRMGPTAGAPKMCRVSSSPSLVKEVGPTPQGNHSQEEYSTVSEQKAPTAEANPRKRKAANNKPKAKESPKNVEAPTSYNAKRVKESEGEKNDVVAGKATEEETKGNANSGDENQLKASPKPPEPPKDYIHVRARRGQATDSHSLAERVRREKISERMKLLQDLVPGCNKVTGKALMLDEIINYVQSLQRQVEFLSMKLASVNTRLDGNIDPPMSKDVFQPNNAMSHPIFPLDSSAQAIFGHQSQALHGNISSGPMTHSIDPLDTSSLCQSLGIQLNGFTDIVSQYQAFGEDDLQSIVQMGFGQNPNGDTSLQPQSIHGPNQLSHMKIEL